MSFLPSVSHYDVSNIRGAADIIEEVSVNLIYFGFFKPGVDGKTKEQIKAGPYCSIMKIEISGTSYPIVTEYSWAGGLCSFDKVWNDRAALEYKIKKF